MSNPILVEVLRGSVVESRHRGAVAVSDADGTLLLEIGDVRSGIFPRSAVKGFQALPLVENGFADDLGLTEAELALACASHLGEDAHVATATAILAKAGADPSHLECGTHWPLDKRAARALAATGRQPSALHNNCSGKHSGFLCLCRGLGAPFTGYVAPGHPAQRAVLAAIEGITGARAETAATDGCSIPTYAFSLAALARGFARFATGQGLEPRRAEAAGRLRAAVARHPFMVGGTGGFDTEVMNVLGARAFTKTGAEGVFCAALPEAGLGVAVKCDDGAGRAAEAAIAAVLARFVPFTASDRERLTGRLSPALVNWNGIEVGRIRVTSSLTTPGSR